MSKQIFLETLKFCKEKCTYGQREEAAGTDGQALRLEDFCDIEKIDGDTRWELMKSFFNIEQAKSKISAKDLENFCEKSRLLIIDQFKNKVWKNKKKSSQNSKTALY